MQIRVQLFLRRNLDCFAWQIIFFLKLNILNEPGRMFLIAAVLEKRLGQISVVDHLFVPPPIRSWLKMMPGCCSPILRSQKLTFLKAAPNLPNLMRMSCDSWDCRMASVRQALQLGICNASPTSLLPLFGRSGGKRNVATAGWKVLLSSDPAQNAQTSPPSLNGCRTPYWEWSVLLKALP